MRSTLILVHIRTLICTIKDRGDEKYLKIKYLNIKVIYTIEDRGDEKYLNIKYLNINIKYLNRASTYLNVNFKYLNRESTKYLIT
jgi:hypothetical protein